MTQDSPGEYAFLILRNLLPALVGDSAPQALGQLEKIFSFEKLAIAFKSKIERG